MKENLYPGEKLILPLDGMSHISRGRAELGTLFLTNYHIIYNPQYVYETGKIPFLRRIVIFIYFCVLIETREDGPATPPKMLVKGWKIGLGYISRIEGPEESDADGRYFQFHLHCKDYTVISMSTLPDTPQPQNYATFVVQKLHELCSSISTLDLAQRHNCQPFIHGQAFKSHSPSIAMGSPFPSSATLIAG